MSTSDIQPVNGNQSYWDIKTALKPALVIASIGIALAATASYFLAAENEETTMEATNYAIVPSYASSGAVSTIQDIGTAGIAILNGFTGLAVAAWVNKTNPNLSEQNEPELPASDIQSDMSIARLMISAESIPVSGSKRNRPTTTHQMTGAELTKEIAILLKSGKEEEILQLLQPETTITLTNQEKLTILQLLEHKTRGSDFTKKFIERLDPTFNDHDFSWFLKLNAYENPALFRVICKKYKITNTKLAEAFIYSEIENLKHFKNQPIFYKLSKETTLIFIEIHGKSLLNSMEFFDHIKQSEQFLDLEFFKSLHSLGWHSRFFNIPINEHEQTLIHKFFRAGDVSFVKKLAKDIPIESTYLGDHVFLEELKDCFESHPIEEAVIRQEGNIFAQNGCRTIILTKDGQVLAIPGRDVKTLLPPDSQPTVTVYLNEGHASIAFADGSHYGFFPEAAGDEAFASTPWKSSAASTPKKPLPLVTAIFFGSAASPLLSTDCKVESDHKQKSYSEKHNQLKLDIYASEEQVLAMQDHIKKTTKNCQNSQEFYHLFFHNCIDFIQDVIGSSGIKADIRNAFSRSEFLRRPGGANLYTIIRSQGPTLPQSGPFPEHTEVLIQGMIPLVTASAVYLSGYAVRKISQGTWAVGSYLVQGTFAGASYLWRKVTRQ